MPLSTIIVYLMCVIRMQYHSAVWPHLCHICENVEVIP